MLPVKQIAAFRRKALASKNEILAVLVGRLIYKGKHLTEILVEGLHYPEQEVTRDSVTYDTIDIVRLQVEVLADEGLQVLGTIHSHPGYEPAISKQDIIAAKYETVFGVYSFWGTGRRRQSSLDWYYGAQRLT